MKAGANDSHQFSEWVAPDFRILAQVFNYLYLNIYLLSILKRKRKNFLNEKFFYKILNFENRYFIPPPTINEHYTAA